ncbi:Rieske 2Fe-2S domain-containing protein [Deinococcus hopiensis]|uniref:Rieske Fe-S protein n=1 Tax=Deinococcus hopiensis KR-140 TaxID=695939 RepID=A0A1W1VGV4_9DEIO|nr:Rieske 2Fe-2S domain-containing protein [Deinococcus hopiensis]SMB92615.1 Rieske Fe-S protein [Deinococcus hopiensis KR-140]
MRLSRREVLERWWTLPVAGTLGAFGYMGWYASRVTFGKRKAGAPDFQPGEAVRVTTTGTLAQDWAEVPFTYGGRPCVALHVPRPVAGGLSVGGVHYAAYSRVCTHLGCLVNLVRDPEVLAFAYNYRPPQNDPHPQLGCPCHFSVFDPLRAGEAVFGKAYRPLPRVRLEVRGGDVYATGIEAAPAAGT